MIPSNSLSMVNIISNDSNLSTFVSVFCPSSLIKNILPLFNLIAGHFSISCRYYHWNERLHIFFDCFCLYLHVSWAFSWLWPADYSPSLNDNWLLNKNLFVILGLRLSYDFNLFLGTCMVDVLFYHFLLELSLNQTGLSLEWRHFWRWSLISWLILFIFYLKFNRN